MKNKNLGREIMRQRTYLRLSQALIAAKVGRTQRWVSMIERGELAIDRHNATRILTAISRIGKELLQNIPQDYSDLKLVARLASPKIKGLRKTRLSVGSPSNRP
jgi:predicted transcriptional regulator